ncbi:MAG: hypothetical protein AMXMBFR84_40380 [Candidatus Hydrogenedentota bacterium]
MRQLVQLLAILIVACSVEGKVDSWSQSFDFGIRTAGSEVTHTFTFRNVSSRPLRVSHIANSCGCTVGSIEKETIGPGQDAAIRVVIKTEAKRGRLAESTMLSFEDGSTAVFYITGYIESVDLEFRDIGLVLRNGRDEYVFLLPDTSNNQLNVSGTIFNHQFFDVKSLKVSGGTEIRVRLKDSIPFGRFSETIRILTSDTDLPERQIRIAGFVETPIIVSESKVVLGVLRDDRLLKELRITPPYAFELDALRVEQISGPKIGFDLDRKNSAQLTLSLTIVPESTPNSNVYKAALAVIGSAGGYDVNIPIEVYGLYRPTGLNPL